jgi:catechol 2,3-dioxygenase-like lactoylglutathione lyase family enzyme
MPVLGLSHITFVVRDLERTSRLWTEGLGAVRIYDGSPQNFSLSREQFFSLAGIWVAVMEGEPASRSYRHVAFRVADEELDVLEVRLRALGVEMMPPRARVHGEGRSLYFYDYDDNLFELHAGSLEERLKAYARQTGME